MTRWRPLETGELDHERLWLGVSLATGAGVWAWQRLGLPVPPCTFHAMTGCPCPACGTTRAVRQLMRGNVATAFEFNPLAVAGIALVAAFCLYAMLVLALDLPRLRFEKLSPRAARTMRISAVAALATNWAWLIYVGR